MYKCDRCNYTVGPRNKILRKVTKTRPKKYMNKSIKELNKVLITEGWEIVEEQQLCNRCYES